MLKAKAYASEHCEVELCSVQAAVSKAFVPHGFVSLQPLSRVVSDVVSDTSKPYPFLGDIVLQHKAHARADYLIYSNLDIALMPYFYESVAEYLKQGYDALVINRRRLNNRLVQEKNMSLLYAEAGREHTGYDCFVFKRELVDRFIFKNICLGVPGAGNDLFYNIFTFADNPILFPEKHLTFHVGLELYKAWGDSATNAHNSKEFMSLLTDLKPYMKAHKFPGADLGLFSRHVRWLMNPTFHYPTMLWLDYKRRFKKAAPKFNQTFSYTRKQKYLEWLLKMVNFKE